MRQIPIIVWWICIFCAPNNAQHLLLDDFIGQSSNLFNLSTIPIEGGDGERAEGALIASILMDADGKNEEEEEQNSDSDSKNGKETVVANDSVANATTTPLTFEPLISDNLTTIPVQNAPEDDFLPTALEPVLYALVLSLDSESDLIHGQMQLELQCRESTAQLLLHVQPDFVAVDYCILESRLPNRTLPFGAVHTDWRRHLLRIELAEERLEAGHVYYLSCWFVARYAYDGRGLALHRDPVRGTWLNTLLEPSYARRLFPCFDEPRFHAAFRLEVWLKNAFAAQDYVALSNTEGQCRHWHANLSICSFATTPPLPTYLFTLAVGRFRAVCNNQSESPSTETGICVWRLAPPEEEQWEQRAAAVIQAMAHFQTGMTDYLLADSAARLHLLVVPMLVNGMENFGLLNVREALWPPQNASAAAVFRFEKTLFHEMTHQWFGNLVTPSRWSCIWLSESLTTFLSSPRPIVFDASTDLSSRALVDAAWARDEAFLRAGIPRILYTKGAAILEMLDALIGAANMQRLLRTFVRRHQFGSASTSDFLALLEEEVAEKNGKPSALEPSAVGSVPVVHFLERWLHLPSHPIVFVDFDARLAQLCLSQTPKMGSPDRRWPIPVWIECLEGTRPETLHWIPDSGDGQLTIALGQLTRTNSTRSLAFNRNRSVYYQLTRRVRNP